MRLSKTTLTLLLAGILIFHEQGFAIGNQQFDYEKGLAFKEQGRYEDALKTWWQARIEMEMRGKSAPRLGVAFIELATAQNLEKYYGTASDMYFWGFSHADMNGSKKALETEVERILPLLEKKVQQEWKKLLKQNSRTLLQKITQFWIEQDVRPTTPGNERLIEHWERIAYSRKHFTKNKRSIYGCDDRGTIYVKYGKPDRKKTGFFGMSGASNIALMERVPNFKARSKIKFWDPNPEYEIWGYDNLENEYTTNFIFSKRYGTGSFGLVEGIELAIYEDSFASPYWSTYLMMYYTELFSFDPYFEERYNQIKEMRGHEKASKIQAFAKPTYYYAKDDKSSFEDRFAPINISTYPVRLLGQRNQPKIAVIAISSPRFRAPEIIENETGELAIPDYRLEQTLIIRDASLKERRRQIDQVSRGSDHVSVFKTDHKGDFTHFTVAVEAFAAGSDFTTAQNSAAKDTSKMLALGKTIFRPQPPLSNKRDALQLSDLVLGVESPANMGFPFPILPARQFSRNDPLQVYVEVYHLRPDADGAARFRMEFRVAKLDKKGRVNKKAGQITLSFDLTAPGHTSKEIFGVDISKLKPGEYEFLTRVKDKVSGRKRSRRAKFTVVE